MSPNASPHEWLDRLPKHLAAAGALFTDAVGRVLVVKPTRRTGTMRYLSPGR